MKERPSKGHGGVMSAPQTAKVAMILLPTLLLISDAICNTHCSAILDNSTDMLSLLDFKRAIINDPRQALSSWNTGISRCQWEGVKCSLTHPGRVTALNLGGLGLSGPISPSLGNLTFLKSLNLSANGFAGELPPFNRLHNLQRLVMRDNSLQGVIPNTLTNCSNLIHLDLSGNFLVGEIPHNIGFLSNLLSLVLFQNNLTGRIPPSLGNISQQLKGMDLADNQLTGSSPDEIGQMPNLLGLVLSDNRLSGGIPLYNHSSLLLLDVGSNMLEKALTSDFGDNLPSLRTLMLGSNKLHGHIPASLGNISELATLDLSSNNFIGQVPTSLGRLGMLSFLNLQANKLSSKDTQGWEFIGGLSNCSSLNVLGLAQNQLQGAIPNSIGKLSTQLQELGLDENELSGPVLVNIGNLSALTVLDLSNNKLDGPIEGWVG
ncbi:unnamed protein product [Triticum turgidum subsp. durum]|uniref:Leucine-rich repeat-containing N-terminal plant-type domain-containing protein n=1 Tax=Triticum turgidum subsp. durum TaxID=4567 RepID=A0A9R0QFD3_TRITD|nr:unnamed protein product [Triticum turgidum subsp. durum]